MMRIISASYLHRVISRNILNISLSHTRMMATTPNLKALLSVGDVKTLLKVVDAVCFDVDSTVIADEGIDVLAEFNGAGTAVAELTKKAMGGTVLFQEALQSRLELIKPSQADVRNCLAKHPPRLNKKIKELVDILHEQGKHVYLVSGGFRLMINPVAEQLRIPLHRVFANTLLFKQDGSFQDFDRDEPTSKDGGKPFVVQRLKEQHGYERVIMIGDGATDLQARTAGPADAFIGYGGIVVRQPVKEGADWFITDFQDLIDVLSSR